jgi:hypothetical protein
VNVEGLRVVRIFVALFDYDPPTMSPNPENCDEELPFREGQLIKVICTTFKNYIEYGGKDYTSSLQI